jgi:hypothetical protein
MIRHSSVVSNRLHLFPQNLLVFIFVDLYKMLEDHEREKKKKYLKASLEQRWHFSPFVVSTDGLLGARNHAPCSRNVPPSLLRS